VVDRFVPEPKVRSMDNRATTKNIKEVDELKKIVFLIIASLLILALVLPGCDGGNGVVVRPKIKIGIPYPFGTVQGTSMLAGAQLAASQINVAGVFVSSENKTYDIQIIGRNDNEISDPSNAWHAVDYLVNTAGAQFIIGGFRTEAVIPMITNVFAAATPPVPYFICGSSTAELLAGINLLYGGGQYPVGSGTPYYTFNASTSDFYEYMFRVTPFNSGFLMGMVMTTFAQVTQDIQTAMNWTWNATGTGTWPHKVNVAIVAENLTWAGPIIGGYQALVAGMGGLFGWNLTVTRTFSDNPSPGVVDAALNAIEAAKNEVILTCMSGPCGLTFGKRMGALGINAMAVGINVEGQDLNYYINTAGGAANEVVTATWAAGVNNTVKTAQFLADYSAYTGGAFPIYTASSYDMVMSLSEAIVGAGSLDKDLVCDWIRTHSRVGTTSLQAYYPAWDQVTHKLDSKGRDLPALNASQVSGIYGPLAVAGYNFTMPPYTTNDLIYGVGWSTGICAQWRNGTQIGVYPNAGYDLPYGAPHPLLLVKLPPQSTLQSTLCGLYWSNTLEYPGTSDVLIPHALKTQWAAWFP
jgi:branched-chain amino acid transport system substrate-binding protein